MAKLPVSAEKIVEDFGPHLNYSPKEGYDGRDEPDEIVKTHCCFCGMQCGIQLLVKSNKVVGFEPWMEFPFNEGRLCPKGVQRYLQNNHPDRLLGPIKRVEGKGFETTTWDEAMDKTVSEIKRIQEQYGKDAFSILSGVSLTNEKSYLMGKFARVAVKTKNLDYNGRLCMVSAGAGNKKAFGLDRASNTYSDLEYAEVIIVAGANISETFPTLTHWIWKARDRGAKLIVIDPRMIPLARTSDIHLDVRPGTDSALYGAMLKYLVDNDLLDHDFIDNYTSGGREHGHKCDQLPGNRDIENPEHRKYISEVWGIDEKDMPGKGLTAYEIIEAIHRGEIKGLLSICFNPLVSLPNSNYVREALEKLEFYVCIDFFLNETARHADIVLAGSLQEEEEGTTTSAEGRVIRIRQAVTPPGDARTDTSIILELAKRLGEEDKFTYDDSEAIFNELRVASKGGTADYNGITYKRVEENMGIFWPCPTEDHPGTPRLWEDKKFKTPDGKAHFNPAPYKLPGEVTDADYPVILTTGRVVSQYLSGTQTRRIGKLVDQYPEPLLEIHPALAKKFGIKQRELVKVSTRRGEGIFPANIVETIREDTVFIPYHWSGKKSANLLTPGTLDPISKIPEFKVCACHLEPLNEIAAPSKASKAYASV